MAKRLTLQTDLTEDSLFCNNFILNREFFSFGNIEEAIFNTSPLAWIDEKLHKSIRDLWGLDHSLYKELKEADDTFYSNGDETYHCVKCGKRLYFRTFDLCNKCCKEYERDIAVTEAEEILCIEHVITSDILL